MPWKAERRLGMNEARGHFPMLRQRWPHAFPRLSHLIRPLTLDAVTVMSAELGWTRAYAGGVLAIWKQGSAYSRATLCYPERINLDGRPTGQLVSEEARQSARRQLAVLEVRQANRMARASAKEDAAQVVEAA